MIAKGKNLGNNDNNYLFYSKNIQKKRYSNTISIICNLLIPSTVAFVAAAAPLELEPV